MSDLGDTTLKILISGLPMYIRYDELEPIVAEYGKLQQCEAVASTDPHSQTVLVTYETADQAGNAAGALNGADFDGCMLRVQRADQRRKLRIPQSGVSCPGRLAVLPLRIIMPSDFVGAVIGPQGATIRDISLQSSARIDIHRKDHFGSPEKAFTIYANAEGCTIACKRILEVMQQEAHTKNKGEIPLKILAHDNFIGRIIGKNGNTIKRIMEETDTKIAVSAIREESCYNADRVIIINGTPANISRAEAEISSKLRTSYENDLLAMTPHSMMFPGLHPLAMASTPGNGRTFPGLPFTSGHGFSTLSNVAIPPVFPTHTQETAYMYVPNCMVGAIIGRKGYHIRKIIRFSNSSISITSFDHPLDEETERKITIIGSPEGQWKAQYMIFDAVREESCLSCLEEVTLTVELLVAGSQIGRIIGKGGKQVRELQRITGTVIKFPNQTGAPVSIGDEETPVHIIGSFYCVQSAQRRIRSVIMSANPPPLTKKQKAAREAAAAAAAAVVLESSNLEQSTQSTPDGVTVSSAAE